MPLKIHFISGLPRAGSTLLSAVLAQNPRFRANMSGPVASFVTALLGRMGPDNEYTVFLDEAQKRAILKGLFENYYTADADNVVFDTNRTWCSKMPLLTELFPEAKVIACVRETSWVIDSVESLIRRNTFDVSKLFNPDAAATVFARAEALSRGDGMVGFAMNALKEAFYGKQAHNLMLLRYETLTSRPADALKAVYEFIGEKPFAHDFDNLEFDATEFDARLGTPGLHRVGKRVRFERRETVLPPEIFRRYENDNFWENPALNPRNVLIV